VVEKDCGEWWINVISAGRLWRVVDKHRDKWRKIEEM
jgi:hypothetical protein